MILKLHIPCYREIFAIPDFLQTPILTFGCQGVEGTQREETPQANPFIPRLRRFLASRGKMRRQRAEAEVSWHVEQICATT